MIEDLRSMVDELSQQIAADIQGDGAAAYGTSANNPAACEPLTFDALRRMMANFPPALSGWSVKLIEVEPYPIYGPARRHRKRRIQKKWLKRYGRKIVGYEYPMADSVLVDKKRDVGYCHPHVARRIREITTAA